MKRSGKYLAVVLVLEYVSKVKDTGETVGMVTVLERLDNEVMVFLDAEDKNYCL